MERNVTKIAVTMPHTKRLRAAAYCRVSGGTEETKRSLTTQVNYFKKHIENAENLEFAGIYAEARATGTKCERPEFQRLIADCRAGLIDIVLTKSISRLARNTLTLLETVRELKSLGIDVFFEEQNIHTLSERGELMLTIMASIAQEESHTVSENIKWRKRRDMASGRTVPAKVYGYDVRDGKLVPNAEQAQIVQIIFVDFLGGLGCTKIAGFLNSCGLESPRGKMWSKNTVKYILQNEKMRGNSLYQQTFVKDHINKKQVKNNGELPQYFISDSHTGIVGDALFEAVQSKMQRRGSHA